MRNLTQEEEDFAGFLVTWMATNRTLSDPRNGDIGAVGLLRLKVHDPVVRARAHEIARNFFEHHLTELMAETEEPTRTSNPNAETE